MKYINPLEKVAIDLEYKELNIKFDEGVLVVYSERGRNIILQDSLNIIRHWETFPNLIYFEHASDRYSEGFKEFPLLIEQIKVGKIKNPPNSNNAEWRASL